MIGFYTILFNLFLWTNNAECEKVKVTVEEGVLVGEKIISPDIDTYYYSFKGIPYARPPVRELRFKAPLPALPYEEEEKDATQFGPMCVQKELDTERVVGDEDCLYLNIYTPNLKPYKLLPVVFFIPGTLYKYGSGNNDLYGPEYLMNYDVCLVTINYRLGALGFLSLGTKDIPGNAGLKDQVLAMQWVQNNIKSFGCDPNQVTIFGQGAGAASVTLHLVSPLSAGLFNRAIASSGVFFCDWSSPFQPIRRAYGLGRNLGFATDDPVLLKFFLQSQPVERLTVNPDIIIGDNVTNILKQNYWTPVVEPYFGKGQFITENPVDLLRKGKINNVDLLMGHTELEGLTFTYMYLPLILEYYPHMYELLVPARITALKSPADNLIRYDIIKRYYFGEDFIGLDTIEEFINLYSTSIQLYPIHEFINQYPQGGTTKLYFYHFNVLADRNYYYRIAKSLGIRKASLGDDLPYVFDGEIFYPKLSPYNDSEEYVDLMCTLFTNFVKFGNPTPEKINDVDWPEYGASKNYVLITNDGLVPQVTGFNDGSLKFWRDLHDDAKVDFRHPWENSYI